MSYSSNRVSVSIHFQIETQRKVFIYICLGVALAGGSALYQELLRSNRWFNGII